MMQVQATTKCPNNEFFEICKELIMSIDANSSNGFELYFGAKGCRYHTLNDVLIIPKNNSSVKINIVCESFNDSIEISQPTKIYQTPCEPYPCFNLVFGNKAYKKCCTWNATIVIYGPCDIIQTPQQIWD